MNKKIYFWMFIVAAMVVGVWSYHWCSFPNQTSFTVGNLFQVLATLALPFIFYVTVQRHDKHVQYYLDDLADVKENLHALQMQMAKCYHEDTTASVQALYLEQNTVLFASTHRYLVLQDLADKQNFTIGKKEFEILIAYLTKFNNTKQSTSRVLKDDERYKYVQDQILLLGDILVMHRLIECALKGIAHPNVIND